MSRMNFISREPVDVRDIKFQFGISGHLFFDRVKKYVPVLCFFSLGKSAHYSPSLFTNHWEKSGQSIFAQIHMQSIVLISPVDVDIRHVKDPFKCAAAKIDAERMANKAVCSVASNYILCLDRFEIARCIFNI